MDELKRMKELAGIIDEASIGKATKEIKIVVDIDKSIHAGERQTRHGEDNPITNDDIGLSTKKAIPALTKLLLFDKIRIGDDIVIQTKSGLNIVGNLQQHGDEIVLKVITVMNKKGFKPKSGTTPIKV